MTQSRELLRTAWRAVGREMQRPAPVANSGLAQTVARNPSPTGARPRCCCRCRPPNEEGDRDCRAGGRCSAKATKEAGERHFPFPAATGNSGFFLGSPAPKVFCNQNLARDSPAESKARQGNGREAQKTAGSPLGIGRLLLSS